MTRSESSSSRTSAFQKVPAGIVLHLRSHETFYRCDTVREGPRTGNKSAFIVNKELKFSRFT